MQGIKPGTLEPSEEMQGLASVNENRHPHLPFMGAARRCAGPAASWPTNPRLDRPETANRLAGRSPPSKADRASGVSPHEVAGYARTFKGRGPTLSDDDYRTRSWLRLGAGHRAGIQNQPAGRPPTADRRQKSARRGWVSDGGPSPLQYATSTAL